MYTLSSLLGIKIARLVDHTRVSPCTGDGCGSCQHFEDVIAQFSPEEGGELDNDSKKGLETITNMMNVHKELRKRVTGVRNDFDFKKDLWPLSVFKEVDDPLPGKQVAERPEYQYFRFHLPDQSGHVLLLHHKTEGTYQGIAFLNNPKNPEHQQVLAGTPSQLSTKAVFDVQRLYFRKAGLEHPWFNRES